MPQFIDHIAKIRLKALKQATSIIAKVDTQTKVRNIEMLS